VIPGPSLERQLAALEVEAGELLEAHQPDKERDYSGYADDPVGFMRDVLDWDPWEAQIEIAEAVQAHAFVVVRGCNGAGKDAVSARLALWWVYARAGLAIVTGPTQRQVKEIVFGEIARAFRPELPGELFQTQLRIEGEARIIGVVSNTASRMTGFHGANVFTIITEAQGVEPIGWEAMLACRVGDDDKSLAVGNPLSPSGQFFESSRRGLWHAIRIAAEDHPNVREGRTVIPGGPSRTWVENVAAEYGRGSGTYRSRVLGEFPDTGEEGLFRRAWLDEAADRHETEEDSEGEPIIRDGVFEGMKAPPRPIVSIDPARYGPDSTCLAVRRGMRIERLVTWGSKDTMATVARAVDELTAAGVRPGDPVPPDVGALPWALREKLLAPLAKPHGRVIVDVVGLGAGVVDRLREKGYSVVAYNGGAFTTSAKRARFLNTRAESFWRLRELLEDGLIDLPRDEKLFDELMATNWFPTHDEKVQIEAKVALKGRLGRSPDRADAVVMAFAAESHAPAHFTRITTPFGRAPAASPVRS
jgi:hypothetical protein